jgi:hypothetical protein
MLRDHVLNVILRRSFTTNEVQRTVNVVVRE